MNDQTRTELGQNALGDYRLLHELAYDYRPSKVQVNRFRNTDTERQHISLHMLATTVEDTVILQLQCLGLGTPEWMMSGAPDSATFERWLAAGLLNSQAGI
jgi:hypothetical protein